MGANQQKEAAAAVQYFAHVVSPTTRTTPTVDSFATQLSQHAAVLCGGCSLYTAAQPLVHTLLAHTEQTGRLRWLLYTCCTLFDSAVQGHAAATPSQLAALRVMELVLRHTHAAVHGRCDTLLRLLCATGTRDDNNDDDDNSNSNSNSKANEDVASWLCQLLMVYTVDVELSKTTAATHAAVMCLLLTLTSSALHHSCALREAYVDVFTEMMMSCSVLKRFVLVLLHRTARWGTAPAVSSPLLYANSNAPLLHKMMSWLRTPPGGARRGGSGGGAAGGSASSVGKDKTHWLTLAAELQRSDKASNNSNSKNNNAEDDGYTTHEHSGSNNNSGSGIVVLDCCGCAELVSRHSAQLLAVLVAHQKGNGCNPALMYVMAMRDQQPIPFATLLRSLAVKLPSCPALCMVLYVLLHDHATFLRDTLALDAGAVVAVVHSLLQLLHAASSIPTRTTTATTQAHSDATRATRATSVTAAVPLPRLYALMCEAVRFAAPFVAFMAATLLLIASQQRRVAALLADAVCSSTPLLPSSYAGRHVSMAALTVVVLGVAVTRALRDGHEALADVLTPCLVNVASAVHDLDAVSAHRFIALVAELIARVRYMAHEHAQLTAAAAATATSMSDSDKETTAAATTRLQASCQMYLRQLAVVVEALEAMFADGSRRNDTLTYALLYTRDAFIATSCDGDDGSSGSSSSDSGDDSDKVSGGGEACSTHDILVALRQTCRRCVARIHDYACVLAHPAARGTQTADDIMRRIRCKSSADTTACIASPHSNKDSHSNDNKATTGASDDTAQRGSDSDDDGEDTTRAATTVVAHDGCDADESTAQHDSQSNSRKEGNNDSNNDDDASAFVYEELPNSYSFFGCFVWAVLLSDARYPGGVLWTTELHTLPLFPRSD